MTVEEKRKKLFEFCRYRSCTDCPLRGPDIPCGRGHSWYPGGMPEDQILKAYDIVFGGNGMKKFTKKDLQDGDVVKHRNCSIGIFIAKTQSFIYKDGYDLLSGFTDDLKSTEDDNSECDIVEIRRPIESVDCQFNAFANEWGELVYKREDPVEMTLSEVCKALGKEIKIVKEK